MQKYLWDRLDKHEIRSYVKDWVQTKFARYGFRIDETEGNKRGTVLLAKYNNSPSIEVFCSYLRGIPNPVYIRKTKFALDEQHYLAFALLLEGKPPSLYLIPSTIWKTPDSVFVDHPYAKPGQTSKPEWGIYVSQKNLHVLEPYFIDSTIEKLIRASI